MRKFVRARGGGAKNRESENQNRAPHGAILHLVAAPLGNLRDISLRALDVLRDCDFVAAEDTRVARKLLAAHGIAGKKILSARAQNEEAAAQKIIAALLAGDSLCAAYLTDAGTPGISDPGARIARRAREAGIAVTVLPGASALTAALCAAGAGENPAHFFGFPPRAKGKRKKFFAELSAYSGAVVLFESPRRAADCCARLAESLGENARVVVCRELTKSYEQIVEGAAGEITAAFANGEIPARGEFTLTADAPGRRAPALSPEAVFDLLRRELPPRRAAALAAKLTGANSAELYRKHSGRER